MAEVDVAVTLGGVLPITVPATSTSQDVLQGGGILAGWSLRDASGDVPTSVTGSVVAPAAGATIIATGALPAGTYDVTVTVGLQGPAAAGDANNFQLFNGATLVGTSVNPGAQGEYPQPTVGLTVAQNGVLTVKALGAGTAGVTYSATIDVNPTLFVETIVELSSGGNVMGEVSLETNKSDTEHFGTNGPIIEQKLTLTVVQGIVKGCVYIVPSSP